ncbi:hypothetical protein MMC18_003383 [Xylographa bjoerkii]|nr:hypothetical protein [Xylographa bjoerkii]
MDILSPTDLVSGLTSNGFSFDTVTSKLDSDLSKQIEGGDEGVSFTTSAFLVVTRTKDGVCFLRQLGFSFASDINWTILQNRLALSALSLGALFAHQSSTAPWNAYLGISGTIFVNNIELTVTGEVNLGATSAIDLSIEAGTFQQISPETVSKAVLGSDPTTGYDSSKYDSAFDLPPSIDYPKVGENEFSANLSILKDGTDWFVSSASISLSWSDISWYPITDLDIALDAVYFQATIRRDTAHEQQAGKPSTAPLLYSAVLGATLLLAGLPLSAVVTYDSSTSITTLTCTMDDDATVSLQDIASDALINPSDANKAHNLDAVAANAPEPDSAPVALSWCNLTYWRTDTICILTLDDRTLSRLQLKASFQLDWQITSSLQLTQMGIFFDITNPISNDLPSVIKGYVYGEIVVNNIQIFAFVAGIKQPTGSEFAVGLTASYNPGASLGKANPQSIFSDPKFMVAAVDTNGWLLPSSCPSEASVAKTVTSFDAQMIMRITQTPKPDESGDYDTAIASLQASLEVKASWPIFDNVALTQVYLRVNVFPASPANNNQVSYSSTLAGLVSGPLSTARGTTYNLVLAATIKKDVGQRLSFTATVIASLAGQDNAPVSLAAFLSMPVSGLDGVDVADDPNAKAIPAELTAQPAALLSRSVAACSLTVASISNAWILQEIKASLTQEESWAIIRNKFTISQSTVSLVVLNPRDSATRSIKFAASTLITIGNLIGIFASISVSLSNGREDELVVTLSVSTLQDAQNALTTLVGTGIDVPSGTPPGSTYSATLKLTCKKGDNGFALTKIVVAATSSTQWSLGPFSINGLAIAATFTNIDTSMTTTVGFLASGSIVNVNVNLAILYATQTQTLTVQITSSIQPSQVVGAFVTGGLDPSSPLDPPDITAGTGLHSYATTPTASGQVVFKKAATWNADNLSFGITSGKSKWVLVNDILVAKNLRLALTLSGLSTNNKILSIDLGLNFEFNKRPPPTGAKGLLPCLARATKKELVITVNTSRCSMPQFLYTVTAGYWNPPDSLGLPALGPDDILQALVLTMNWDEGFASFRAVLKDWSLIDKFPKFIGMKEPRFEASISRKSGGFTAVGQLAGIAIAFAIEIPLSFDLPTGPFRVFSIDVKEAYDVAKRLYDTFRTIMDIVEAAEVTAGFMAEVAEFLGALEVAADVAAALAAAGVAAGIISLVIRDNFGGSSSAAPLPDQNDPSSNKNGTNGQPALVLGGSVLSPGPSGQNVDLIVYPKDKFGAELKPFEISQLFVGTITSTNERQNVATAWTPILSGCSTSFPRPSETKMWVEYRGALAITTGFDNVIQPAASVFSFANAEIDAPITIGCLRQGLVVLTPKDQYSLPRFGPDAAPPLLISSFTRDGGGSPPTYDADQGFGVRNDSLLLPFSLQVPGTYSLSIREALNPAGNPRVLQITGVNVIDPRSCIVYGEGLCTGLGGNVVQFYIKLIDQSGRAFVPPTEPQPDIQILLRVSSLPVQELNWSLAADTMYISYTRPVSSAYSIEVMIDGVLFGDGAITLNVTTDATVGPTVTKSICSITNSGSIAAGDQIEGRIITIDTLGHRWYSPSNENRPLFKISSTPINALGAAMITSNGDGSYAFKILTLASGTSQISAVGNADSTQRTIGSPLSVNVMGARLLSSVVVHGSGLNQGYDRTGTINIRGVDQHGGNFPVSLGANVSLTAAYRNTLLPAIANQSSVAAFSYAMPMKGDDPVLVVLRPMGQATFRELLYVVPCSDDSALDVMKSFITWKSIVLDGTSSSSTTLYSVNTAGNRMFTGGAWVQTASVAGTPLVLAQPIKDNQDGSYRLRFTMPPGVTSAPWPQLAVSMNRQALSASPYQFPLRPSPMITTNASGPGLSAAVVGVQQIFTIQCLDANGQLTGAGFQSAAAYVVEASTDIPKFTPCTVASVNNGLITLNYTVPTDWKVGKYNVHIFINFEPIGTSPVEIDVSSESLDDIDELCEVTQYILACPPERWIMSTNTQWTLDNSNPKVTWLTSGSASIQFEGTQSYKLDLSVTDDWLVNGFMFAFDISSQTSSALRVGPITQPSSGQLTMVWNPEVSSSGTGTSLWQFEDSSSGVSSDINVQPLDRLTINWPSPSTIGFFYVLSPDKTQYTMAAFQAGQFISQYQWARSPSVPSLGFTIQRLGGGVSKVAISNITTIPGHFRNIPSGPPYPTATASDYQADCPPTNVLDGNPATFWHSEYSPELKGFPHTITVDLRTVYAVTSFTYTPRGDAHVNGRIGQHSIDFSADGNNWASITQNARWPDEDIQESNSFNPVNARFLRLTATTEAGNRGVWSSAGEIKIGYVGNSDRSAEDIDFHAPWATKYIKIANADGTLDNRGLIYDGQVRINSLKWPWIYQRAVPDFGMSVTAFALQIPKAYNYSNAHTRSSYACVASGGFFFAPLTGRWMDGGGDDVRDVAAAGDMLVGPGKGPNIVYCINGKSFATVFANGKFQFTATSHLGRPMMTLDPPSLNSWWTDVVWHKMRVVSGLKTSAEAGV